MKFDRNTVLGFVILALLFFGYFWYTNKEQAAYRKKKLEQQAKEQVITDSLARLNKPRQDSLNRIQDSIAKVSAKGTFSGVSDTTEKTFTLQNELMKITFSNKGGRLKKVELKNFKGQDSLPVRLAASSFDNLSYTINTGTATAQHTAETSDLYFSSVDSIKNPDGSKKISFTLTAPDSSGRSITHEFTVKPNDYLIDFTIKMSGTSQLLTGSVMNLSWNYAAVLQESGLSYERQNTQVGYVKDGNFDYHSIFKRSSKDFDGSVNWVGIRQRFFMGVLVAKNNFSTGSKVEWTSPPDSANTVLRSTASMKLSVPAGSSSVIPLSFYYGPSDYHILKKYDLKFEKMINLGQGIYSFVRPINRFLVMPIFDVFKGFAGSIGLAIALLTIFIRLLISPLTYTSYLSGAKMKALRPEIAQLKAKFGDDKQAMSMAQMKLFREAGVNPLGGCIPALLQIPIFFALYSFFNSYVDLRGVSFLWATDLSAPDKVIEFGRNIPMLGDHLSIFNVTACITSFLISWYSMSMTPDQSNPMLKYMPYIFPVFLLFIFNRLPSALTWYYTVSNLITLALQVVIQTYIIDHNKILAKIEETRKKPKPKSKWQERMEQMQQQQKKMREIQQKSRR